MPDRAHAETTRGEASEALWARIDKNAEGGCWVFTGKLTDQGYGRVKFAGRPQMVHRIVWELVVGPIQGDLTLDHLCRNRACCNPDHLEPVPLRENILRGEGPTAKNAAKTECPQGHPYTPENTYVKPTGTRECKTCKRAVKTRWDHEAAMASLTEKQEKMLRRAVARGKAEVHGRGAPRTAKGLEARGLARITHDPVLIQRGYYHQHVEPTDAGREYVRTLEAS